VRDQNPVTGVVRLRRCRSRRSVCARASGRSIIGSDRFTAIDVKEGSGDVSGGFGGRGSCLLSPNRWSLAVWLASRDHAHTRRAVRLTALVNKLHTCNADACTSW
jgi:hypothetical protein